jgi:hypothetical protein
MFNELLAKNPAVYEKIRKRCGTARLATGGSITRSTEDVICIPDN